MTRLEDLPLRDELRGQRPYGAPQIDVPVRLNTNENPHPPSAALAADIAAAVAEVAGRLNRYPDREVAALRGDLGRYLGHGLGADAVWAANGSNEVLQQVLQAFGGPGRRALGFEPTYSMHRLIARSTGTDYFAARRRPDFTLPAVDAVAAVRAHRPHVVFLCSPNNPTGNALDADLVAAVYAAAQECGPAVLIVDEAYAEFSRRRSAVSLLPGRRCLIVTRTLSKAFALAGARVGYLAADPAVIDALQLVRLPYHLGAVTQAVARAALAHSDELLATVAAVREQRDRLVAELRALDCEVIDSDASFVLFGRFADSAAAWQGLLDRGVLVRDPGLPGWLRVSAGLEAEVDAFLDALRAVRKADAGRLEGGS